MRSISVLLMALLISSQVLAEFREANTVCQFLAKTWSANGERADTCTQITSKGEFDGYAVDVCYHLAHVWSETGASANSCLAVIQDGYFDRNAVAVCHKLSFVSSASLLKSSAKSIDCLTAIRGFRYTNAEQLKTCSKLASFWSGNGDPIACLTSAQREMFPRPAPSPSAIPAPSIAPAEYQRQAPGSTR